MSTSGAVGFFCDGKFKVTYNHFDSYPHGLGKRVVGFCRTLDLEKINTLRRKVRKLRMIDEESDVPSRRDQKRFIPIVKKFFRDDSEEMFSPRSYEQLSNGEKIRQWKIRDRVLLLENEFDPKNWYELLRPFQFGKILEFVLKDPHPVMLDSRKFFLGGDYQYAYIINLDDEILDVYNGLQEKPQKDNPLGRKKTKCGYYPPKIIGRFPLLTLALLKEMMG